jgi:hypothetical protein
MSKILFNIIEKDTSILNNIEPDYLWKALNVRFKDYFIKENLYIFKIDKSYNFRPDKVAFKVYGNDFYYPIILYSNQIGSILQFRIDIVGTEVKYLKPEILKN